LSGWLTPFWSYYFGPSEEGDVQEIEERLDKIREAVTTPENIDDNFWPVTGVANGDIRWLLELIDEHYRPLVGKLGFQVYQLQERLKQLENYSI
jgi:hypothetical protein